MKKILIICFMGLIILLSNNFICFSQKIDSIDSNVVKKIGQHTLFFEIGGNSIYLYNITYDYCFQIKEKHKIALGFGFQYLPINISHLSTENTYGIAPQINYLYGQENCLEIGIGLSTISLTDNFWVVPLRIGYRYQQKKGGIFAKIAFVPLIGKKMYVEIGKIKLPFFPSAGISIGYTFKNKK